MNPLKRFLSRLLAWQSASSTSQEPIEARPWDPVEFRQRLSRVARVGTTLPSYQAWAGPGPERLQCRQCQFLNPDPLTRRYLNCSLYPLGPEQDACPDLLPTTED
jgi:hypothetical protein